MMDKMPMRPPSISIHINAASKSPLEEALEKKSKIQTMRQKYNIKNPKDQKLPRMQYEGENEG